MQLKKILALLVSIIMIAICGSGLAQENSTWVCPNCSNVNNTTFCIKCGLKKPEMNTEIVCPGCGEIYPSDTDVIFCGICGTKLSDEVEFVEKKDNSLSSASASFGNWVLRNCIDEFNLPTDNQYITYNTDFIGTFNNILFTGKKLTARILVDASDCSFMLFEYGNYVVKGSFGSDYTIKVLDSLGEQYAFRGTMNSDRIVISHSDIDEFYALLDSNEELHISITDDKYRSKYNFVIDDSSHFGAMYKAFTGKSLIFSKDDVGGESAYSNLVGKTIKFGSYKLRAVVPDVFEPVEWIVLEASDESAILISKYVLDIMRFAKSSYSSPDWVTSDFKYWLNSDFYETAFSAKEKEYIQETVIEANRKVKVYILHSLELKKFEKILGDYTCSPTNFATSYSVFSDVDGKCDWWLRDTDNGKRRTYHYVDYMGNIKKSSSSKDWKGVRPVIKVDISLLVDLKN